MNMLGVPKYTVNTEESNYMKKLLTITKKERARDKIKSTGNRRVPKIRCGNCCQSMAKSRGSDSNVELNDTRINQTSSPMEN
jgi:hypothetical protein